MLDLVGRTIAPDNTLVTVARPPSEFRVYALVVKKEDLGNGRW